MSGSERAEAVTSALTLWRTPMIKNCKVAVVGGAGFLGSHLVDYLLRVRNCKVLVLDNLCVGKREWVPGAEFIHCDITHSEHFLREVFEGVKYVFNYAAWPYIPDSFKRPLHVFDVNATGAMYVINAAHEAGARVLQVSSAEIYGEGDGLINESTPVRPHSTYGVAKAAVDNYVQARWKEDMVQAIALRQFNCIGERETHPYIVPEIITQLLQGEVVLLGNNSTRDFMYARDAVIAAVELLEHGAWGEVYNLGSQDCIKMYDLAARIAAITGLRCTIKQDQRRVRPWEIWHLQADTTKIRGVCPHLRGPQVSLDEMLHRAVNWRTEAGKWPWE